jgi:hypothetical protein
LVRQVAKANDCGGYGPRIKKAASLVTVRRKRDAA